MPEKPEKTYTRAEVLKACEDYADGERFDIGQFLHILDNPEEG